MDMNEKMFTIEVDRRGEGGGHKFYISFTLVLWENSSGNLYKKI